MNGYKQGSASAGSAVLQSAEAVAESIRKDAEAQEKHKKLVSTKEESLKTRTQIVEQLMHRKINQLGKNDLVAMIVAQYAAVERLLGVVAELDPTHSLVRGLRPNAPVAPRRQRWWDLFRKIRSNSK